VSARCLAHRETKAATACATTPDGDPLDRYGRVLYLDTYDSAYGPGWRRENGFVARRPDGTFCYGFVPHRTPEGDTRPPGNGTRYRLAISGPGVTPDVYWEGTPPAAYDSTFDRLANEDLLSLLAGDPHCRPR